MKKTDVARLCREDVVDLIFVLETSSVNKKSELYKAIEKNGKIIFEEGLNSYHIHLFREYVPVHRHNSYQAMCYRACNPRCCLQ